MWPQSRHPPIPASIVMSSRCRRRVWLALVVAAVAGAVVCDRARYHPPVQDDYTQYHDHSFRVVRVVDGDTLDISAPDGDKMATRIRLWGVDTPEITHGHRGANMYFGPEASAFARRMLKGRDVHIILSARKSRGKYGRLLAYVYLERGGPMFNEMLLEKGYAYADLRFPHHYDRRFRAIEKRARQDKLGLWENILPPQMPPWKQRFEKRDQTKTTPSIRP